MVGSSHPLRANIGFFFFLLLLVSSKVIGDSPFVNNTNEYRTNYETNDEEIRSGKRCK